MRPGCVLVIAALAAAALGVGCASCASPRPGQDGDADGPGDGDADVSAGDGDGDTDGDADRDAEADVEVPPGCEALDIEVIPHTREGTDCGRGCRQVTFADAVFSGRYDVEGQYLVYEGGDLGRRALFAVDLEGGSEWRFELCHLAGDKVCTVPGLSGGVALYPTAPLGADVPYTLRRYRIGETFTCPLVTRTMTEERRPLMNVDVQGELVAWYDSAVAPAGLYAMPVGGGDVISLTGNECVCYGAPHLWGRQVVYETWREGPRDIHIVDVDTLEDRAITHSLVQQFSPSFDGRWVVWTDSRNDPSEGDPYNHRVNPDIFGLELPDGPERAICDHPAVQLDPEVDDGLVSWTDFRNSESPNDGNDEEADTDVYLYDLRTGEEHQVTSGPPRQRTARMSRRMLYYVAADSTGTDAVFEVDLVERLGIAP